MITTGRGSQDRARGIPTQAIRYQPFVVKASLYIATDIATKIEIPGICRRTLRCPVVIIAAHGCISLAALPLCTAFVWSCLTDASPSAPSPYNGEGWGKKATG